MKAWNVRAMYMQADAFKMHSIWLEENYIQVLVLIRINLIFKSASYYCDIQALPTSANWITLISEP